MRLFVAIMPSEEALEDLAGRVAELGKTVADGPQYRWTLADHWHLTLAFLGEVEDRVLPELYRRLERAAARHPVLRLRLAGAGAFPSAPRARVLWAGVEGDVTSSSKRSRGTSARRASEEPKPDHEVEGDVTSSSKRAKGNGVERLRGLAWSVAAAARRSGIAIEERRYRPHLTLARLSEPTDVRASVAALADLRGPYWDTEEIRLVRSHLARGEGRRAVHETIATWPLKGRTG